MHPGRFNGAALLSNKLNCVFASCVLIMQEMCRNGSDPIVLNVVFFKWWKLRLGMSGLVTPWYPTVLVVRKVATYGYNIAESIIYMQFNLN